MNDEKRAIIGVFLMASWLLGFGILALVIKDMFRYFVDGRNILWDRNLVGVVLASACFLIGHFGSKRLAKRK